MTGAIIRLLGDFTQQEAISGMIDMFEEKGKSRYHDINTQAMLIGLEYKSSRISEDVMGILTHPTK